MSEESKNVWTYSKSTNPIDLEAVRQKWIHLIQEYKWVCPQPTLRQIARKRRHKIRVRSWMYRNKK